MEKKIFFTLLATTLFTFSTPSFSMEIDTKDQRPKSVCCSVCYPSNQLIRLQTTSSNTRAQTVLASIGIGVLTVGGMAAGYLGYRQRHTSQVPTDFDGETAYLKGTTRVMETGSYTASAYTSSGFTDSYDDGTSIPAAATSAELLTTQRLPSTRFTTIKTTTPLPSVYGNFLKRVNNRMDPQEFARFINWYSARRSTPDQSPEDQVATWFKHELNAFIAQHVSASRSHCYGSNGITGSITINSEGRIVETPTASRQLRDCAYSVIRLTRHGAQYRQFDWCQQIGGCTSTAVLPFDEIVKTLTSAILHDQASKIVAFREQQQDSSGRTKREARNARQQNLAHSKTWSAAARNVRSAFTDYFSTLWHGFNNLGVKD